MTQTTVALDPTSKDLPADENAGFGALETERGRLPLVALHVEAIISDLTAQTTLRQTFRNPLDEPLDATYIFPLPERAAVSRFRMHVAGRTIEGLLKERAEARVEYDRAIEQGHRAAIAEENRSGVFCLRVGNLLPRETAIIEFTMTGPLPVADGEATFRFPLVVAPRYTPGIPLDGPSVGPGTASDTAEVPDASYVTPPVLLPGFPNPVQLSLAVQLDPTDAHRADTLRAGFRNQIRASLHSTVTDEGPPWTVRLLPGERLDRDFILRFPVAAAALATSIKSSPAADQEPGVLAVTILPPALQSASPPREVVFVLDRSSSMTGWKMVAARRALGRMIDTLLDHDRFTVLAFDSTVEHPPHAQGGLVAATNRQRWQMVEWLGGIEARGGTEMDPALEEAVRLLPAGNQAPGAAPRRMLVLVTDGQITGEDALLRRLAKSAGKQLPRIFTIGIDQAVNAGFLRRLADLGLGHCELVESEERLDQAMDRIHRLIATPVLTQVRVEPLNFDLLEGSLAPARVPDLFVDRPVTLLARHLAAGSSLRLRVHGIDAAGKTWSQEIEGRSAAEQRVQPETNSMLRSMWGRAKVRDLEDTYASGSAEDSAKLSQEIVRVSLACHVLSRFTAYVAVDRGEVVNQGGAAAQVLQPVEMPAGWAMPAAVTGLSTFGAIACCIDFCESAPDNSESIQHWLRLEIATAEQRGATEVRFELLADRIRIVLLIAGQDVELKSVPSQLWTELLSFIRQVANLGPAERNQEQHGVVQTLQGLEHLTLSARIVPSPNGETIVIAIAPLAAPVGNPVPPTQGRKRKKFWA